MKKSCTIITKKTQDDMSDNKWNKLLGFTWKTYHEKIDGDLFIVIISGSKEEIDNYTIKINGRENTELYYSKGE